MRTITVEEFHRELKAQGVSAREDIAFRCCCCGTIQSARTLIAAGAGKDLTEVEKYLGFSCVGRFTNVGPHKRDSKPGRGCDWTLGGLFKLHTLEVVVGPLTHPSFEMATPEEAQSLAAERVLAC